MSNFTKGEGAKIVVKFTENLIGDVSGLTPTPVGGYAKTEIAQNSEIGSQSYSVSNYYTVSYTADKAFDNSTSTFWYTRLAMPQWIQIDFGEGNSYDATKFRWYVSAYRPRAFTLKGSNDLTTWSDALVSAESQNVAGWQEWEFANGTEYRYYRWEITSKWSTYLYLYEIQLFADLPIGNEQAFTITAQEPRWVEFPSETLGELIDSDIQIESVEAYPSTPNQIILNTFPLKRFNNVEGDITVSYNASNGNLQGIGGIVQNFTQVFTPTDLVRVPNPSFGDENIKANLTDYTILLSPIIDNVIGDGEYPTDDIRFQGVKRDANNENIMANMTDYTIVLTNITDIDP